MHAQNRSEATLLRSEEHLRQVLRPFYRDLFSLVACLEGGIKFLVDFRGGLLVGGWVGGCEEWRGRRIGRERRERRGET